MKEFDYYAPETIAEACALLKEIGAGAKVLAGGTDVLIEMRKGTQEPPKAVVDIARIAPLRGIEEAGDSVIVRPLTTHTEILRSRVIAAYAPLLHDAAAGIGSPQIRNRGTIGGNIMNAATCADTVPALVALGARTKLQSSQGERILSLSEFFARPYVTAAHRNELLVEIRFPKLPQHARSCFIKLGRRNALSISRLSVAVILFPGKDGTIEEARIVPGAALPVWQRISDAESLLIGKSPSRELFEEAGKKVSEAMIGFTGRRWSTEYKEPVIAVLVRRALEFCAGVQEGTK